MAHKTYLSIEFQGADSVTWATATGTVDSSKAGMWNTSAGLTQNSVAGPNQFQQSGAAVGRIGTSGMEFTANHSGSISNPSVLRQSGNVVVSGGTGGDVMLNAPVSSTPTNLYQVTASGGLLALADVTTPGSTVTSLGARVSGNLVRNVPTGKNYQWQVAAGGVAQLDVNSLNLYTANGLTFYSSGAFSTTARQVVGLSTGMGFQTPASTDFIFAIGSSHRFIF